LKEIKDKTTWMIHPGVKNVDRVTNRYKLEDIKDNTWTIHPRVKMSIDSQLDRKLKILKDKTWMNDLRVEQSIVLHWTKYG